MGFGSSHVETSPQMVSTAPSEPCVLIRRAPGLWCNPVTEHWDSTTSQSHTYQFSGQFHDRKPTYQ